MTNMRSPKIMLTYDGQDIQEIPLSRSETIVYLVQEQIDSIARKQGKPYGKLVSTRRIEE